jgi:hypothetical protein
MVERIFEGAQVLKEWNLRLQQKNSAVRQLLKGQKGSVKPR